MRASAADTPFYPRPAMVLVAAILAGGLLGACAALLVELRRRDAPQRVDLPASVSTPASSLAARLDMETKPAAQPARGRPHAGRVPAANAGLASIAKAIAEIGEDAGRRVVVATSPKILPELAEIAIRLARQVAATGRRVVLVDTRFNEHIEALLAAAPRSGVADLLAGRCNFEDAVMRDPASRVHVVAAGETTANPLALLSCDKMEMVVRALGETYDIVILIGPPLTRRGESGCSLAGRISRW
jgi:Mrp family chromosome partitioning ATPase